MPGDEARPCRWCAGGDADADDADADADDGGKELQEEP